MMDSFYTPASIAEKLLFDVPNAEYGITADFAAGDGALLRAATARFPSTGVVAVDVDRKVVRRLRNRENLWTVLHGDFLDPRSWPKTLHDLKGSVDLALLNPPFSCRGGTRYSIALPDGTISCSLAMAFLLQTAMFLSPMGTVAFLLPSGASTSQKDENARHWLRSNGHLSMNATYGRGSFEGCYPSVVSGIYRLGRANDRSSVSIVANLTREWGLTRGTLALHRATTSRNGSRFVHSTCLTDGMLEVGTCRRVRRAGRVVRGPVILLPRVRTPTSKKVCVHLTDEEIVLSDCVIALTCQTADHARATRELLLKRWTDLAGLYQGTCAKFVTLARLENFLSEVSAETRGQWAKAQQQAKLLHPRASAAHANRNISYASAVR